MHVVNQPPPFPVLRVVMAATVTLEVRLAALLAEVRSLHRIAGCLDWMFVCSNHSPLDFMFDPHMVGISPFQVSQCGHSALLKQNLVVIVAVSQEISKVICLLLDFVLNLP